MNDTRRRAHGGWSLRLGRTPTSLVFSGLLLLDCRHAAELSVEQSATVLSATPQAFDVNDLAILLPNTSGHFYPEIALDAASTAALGLRDLWPATAFQPMMAFAGGKDFAGDTAFLAALTGPTTAQPLGQFGLVGASRQHPAQAALALTGGPPPAFNPVHRKIGVYLNAGQEIDDTSAQVALNATFTDETKWRLVSVRFDPCAQAEGSSCSVEMRLIAQPMAPLVGGGLKPLDRSAHLLYHLGKLDLAQARFDPTLPRAGFNKSLKDLFTDLQNFKALAAALGAGTDGKPLGVHPGLQAEMIQHNAQSGAAGAGVVSSGPLANALLKLINDYSSGGLSSVTSMQLVANTSPWVFFQGAVVDKVWHPTGITGNNPQFSIRFVPGASGFLPAPITTPQTSTLFNIDPDDLEGDSSSNLVLAYQMDNPGRYGVDTGLSKVSVVTADCLSCHTTLSRLSSDTTAGSAANVPANLAAMYVPTPGITGYPAPRAVAQFVWNFHNFSVFGSVAGPAVMSRTVNEAAEAARFADEDLLPKIFGVPQPLPKHGFVCKDHAGTPQRLLHARLWDCTVIQGGDFDQCMPGICDLTASSSGS